jgi:hypothetical protein
VDKKKMSFDEMFGNAQEYIPDPNDLNEDEFASLDEEDAGGEEELEDMDLDGIEPSDEPVEEKNGEEDEDDYGFADDEEDEEEEADEDVEE